MNKFERNIDIAFKTEEEILNIQNVLLREHLQYCKLKSPYYKKILVDVNCTTFNLADLPKLPFTDKTEFVKQNYDFLAVPYSEIRDIVLSSGTTGEPAQIMYSEQDIERLAYNEKKSFLACGLTDKDTVLLTCTIDRCFIAGLAYFLGVKAVGATAVRNGLNSVESHMSVIEKLKPTVIVGVPSFLFKLGSYINESGKSNLFKSVNKLICIGEPIRNWDFTLSKLGRKITELWNADLYSTYASSEIVSTFCECTEMKGGHLHPDLVIVEIIGKNGELLNENEVGEVVLTPLQSEGMPLIRFRTGDISFIVRHKCKCGRNSLRLGPILGRKQQMLKIQGTTIYPQAIYTVLDDIPEIMCYYIEAEEKTELSDHVKIFISSKNNSKSFIKSVSEKLRAGVRVFLPIEIKDDKEVRSVVFPETSRKPVKFIDKRRE